jgi:DNA mismatch repair protein MSH5
MVLQLLKMQKILESASLLVDISELAGELDWYYSDTDILSSSVMSLAISAKEFNYQRPTLTHENVIYIQNGRNPLQELCTETFIPNDTSICLGR